MAYPNDGIKTSQYVSEKYLDILTSSLSIIPGVTRDIHGDLDISKARKVGQTAQCKRPAKVKTFDGRTYQSQPYIEDTVDIKFDKQLHTGPEFDIDELAQELAKLDSALMPFAKQHGSDLESWFASDWVGTSGDVSIGSNSGTIQFKDYLLAGANLTNNTATGYPRTAVMDPLTKVNALDKMLENRTEDSESLKKLFREGIVARAASFDFVESTRLPVIAIPADIIGAVAVSYVEGSSLLLIGGLTDGQIFEAGTPITVVGANQILPDTRKNTGRLKQIIIKETATVGAVVTGQLNAVIDPLYYTSTDARQNISAQPVATDVTGSAPGVVAGKVYRQSVCFDERAFGFYSTALKKLPGLDGQAANFDNINVLYSAGGDIKEMDAIYRYDTLTAGVNFYPEYVQRIWEENI